MLRQSGMYISNIVYFMPETFVNQCLQIQGLLAILNVPIISLAISNSNCDCSEGKSRVFCCFHSRGTLQGVIFIIIAGF